MNIVIQIFHSTIVLVVEFARESDNFHTNPKKGLSFPFDRDPPFSEAGAGESIGIGGGKQGPSFSSSSLKASMMHKKGKGGDNSARSGSGDRGGSKGNELQSKNTHCF